MSIEWHDISESPNYELERLYLVAVITPSGDKIVTTAFHEYDEGKDWWAVQYATVDLSGCVIHKWAEMPEFPDVFNKTDLCDGKNDRHGINGIS